MMKKLVIKLGSNCNLSCKYCHCTKSTYEYNEDIIDYIKDNKFNKIVFSGGEPLLYFDVIKKIVEKLDNKENVYSFVTNGFLFDDEKIRFFNENNFGMCLSYDGNTNLHNLRSGYPDDLSFFGKIDKISIATVAYKGNMDLDTISGNINSLMNKYGKYNNSIPNFPHQTKYAPNHDIADKEVAKLFVSQLCTRMEVDIMKLKNLDTANIYTFSFMIHKLRKLYINNYNLRIPRGVACFHDNNISMTISGKFLVCSYDKESSVGNIYTGIDWDMVESFVPDRCKECSIRDICKNTCVMNITDNECFIERNLHKHLYRCLEKYDMTLEEMDTALNKLEELR